VLIDATMKTLGHQSHSLVALSDAGIDTAFELKVQASVLALTCANWD
jgi:hypothetical protein